jgi:hypothetical protein
MTVERLGELESEHLFEREACFVDAASAGERVDVPEAADRERALVA